MYKYLVNDSTVINQRIKNIDEILKKHLSFFITYNWDENEMPSF